jgi:HAE1 family hydrophobic/amphiphilic exporter-1
VGGWDFTPVKLARLAIRQPVFISMVLLAIALAGVLSYMNMGVDLYPDISNPSVFVSVSFPGASPEDVERLVTKPLEDSLSTVSGVESMSANSREGSGSVGISFVVGHDVQQGAQEVRERLDAIKRRLPDGAEAPSLQRFDPNTSPIMTVALNLQGEPLSAMELRRLVEQIVVTRVERLSGVAAVSVGGLRTQEVGVDLNARRLRALGVSPQQVVAALQRENVLSPSGRVSSAAEDVPLRTAADYQDLDDIRRTVVTRSATGQVQVQDVAEVDIRLRERQQQVRINGVDTLVMSVQKQSGGNTVQTAHLVKDELKKLARDYPQLNFNIIRDDSTFIEDSDRDVNITLVLGAVLAAAIVLLFFRNIRNTLITVAGLPIVVIGTFTVMSLLGYTRNIITLMALSLSIGLLIDDAIVVRENIFRHMEKGDPPRTAAENGTGEIAFAVLAITLTLVAVFIPVTFTNGQVGMLLKEFGITVAVAVLISLFEAFTFAPMLTAYLAKPLTMHDGGKAGNTKVGIGERLEVFWLKVAEVYKRVLAWALRHRWMVVGTALALFGLSMGLLQFLPSSFFPVTDPGSFGVGITYPPGTPLMKTDQLAREIEQTLLEQPEVKTVYAQVGSSSNPNQGSMTVYLKEGVKTETVVGRMRKSFQPYGRVVTLNVSRQFLGVGGGGGGASVRGRPVLVAVRGPVDLDTLEGVANDVIARMSTVPGLRDIDKSLPAREPELQIVVDRQRTAQTGITAATVGQTIRTLVSGSTATQVEWNEQRLDVSVRLREEDRSDPVALMNLPVVSTSGQVFTLSSVARIGRGTGPTVLERQDRQRQIMVGANLDGRSAGAVIPDLKQELANIDLPPGVTWLFAGEQAQTDTAFSSLLIAMGLGLVFVYMVLASQFGNLLHPLTVMIALPLSAIGAVLALLIARADLTVISMIGIVLLMGLVTKNSILLVDFSIRYQREGKDRAEAVLAAGPVRLRPILMTTLAIILGMVPTALGIGAAGAFRAPMAVAVIGGVISSTLLSLVVVPVAYTLMDDAVNAAKRRFRRGKAAVLNGSAHAGDEDSRGGKP